MATESPGFQVPQFVDHSCTFCKYDRRRELEIAIGSGAIPKRTAADQLRVPVELIDKHMKEHMPKPQVMGRIIYDKSLITRDSLTLNKRDLLIKNMLMLGQRIASYQDADVMNPSMTKQVLEQLDLYRKYVMDLAKLEGELKQEITVTYNHYMSLRAIVLGGLCPNCSKKVIDILAREEKKNVDGAKPGYKPAIGSAEGRTILIQ